MPKTLSTVSEHTPGPWRSERVVMSKYGIDAYFEVKGGPTEDETVGVFAREVCQTIMREIGSEDYLLAEDQANVCLIAAAPELLEACQAVHTEIIGLTAYLKTCSPDVIEDNLPTVIASLNRKREQIDTALRKAKGLL